MPRSHLLSTSPRVAVVHEWVSARAGSEQVFEALAQAWPEADLYALSKDPSVPMDLGGRPVKTTVLDHPQLRDRRGVTLPAMPLAWQFVGRHQYDTVITSHHAFATSNALAKPGAANLAYVHTPARYVWSPELDGRGTSSLLTPVRAALKAIDRRAVKGLTSVAANSGTVAERIRKYWDRDARVIYPPVDTEFFTPGRDNLVHLDAPEQFILGFGRWIPYKNIDMVIRVAEQAGVPAVIAGRGPMKAQLEAMAASAKVPVTVMESPSNAEVRELMRRASALVFPTEEDFGIVPVEAMACGTPVLALNRGGASETVIDGVTGAVVDDLSPTAFALRLPSVLEMPADKCRAHAETFSRDAFQANVRNWADESQR